MDYLAEAKEQAQFSRETDFPQDVERILRLAMVYAAIAQAEAAQRQAAALEAIAASIEEVRINTL